VERAILDSGLFLFGDLAGWTNSYLLNNIFLEIWLVEMLLNFVESNFAA
jgi:hypothetical protein